MKTTFASDTDAIAGLTRNGLRRFADSLDLPSLLRSFEPPFRAERHPNGPIYTG